MIGLKISIAGNSIQLDYWKKINVHNHITKRSIAVKKYCRFQKATNLYLRKKDTSFLKQQKFAGARCDLGSLEMAAAVLK